MALEWRNSRKDALQRWKDSLTDEERAAFEADRARFRAESEARRAARAVREEAERQRHAEVIGLALRGLSTDEIAEKLGMKARAVRKVCFRFEIPRTQRGMRRVPVGWLPLAHREQLQILAEERGETPERVVELLLSVALEEGAFHGRRLLRNVPSDARGAAA